jgi:hypothetical protein
VPQRRILDAVLEEKCAAVGGEPVQTGRHGERACIAVIAEPRTDLLDALLDVHGVGETVA